MLNNGLNEAMVFFLLHPNLSEVFQNFTKGIVQVFEGGAFGSAGKGLREVGIFDRQQESCYVTVGLFHIMKYRKHLVNNEYGNYKHRGIQLSLEQKVEKKEYGGTQ